MVKAQYEQWLEPDSLHKIAMWAAKGLTDAQIAKNMHISRSTLSEWKKKYSDISDTLKKNKDQADDEVENALYQKAIGMTVVNKQFRTVKIDETQLKANRTVYMNKYKLEHPEATKEQIMLAAAQNVDVYERIQIFEDHHQLPPDTSAAIFWLKNRQPEKYRDQSFKQLNDAQAQEALAKVRKANADADIAEAKAAILRGDSNDQDQTIVVDSWGEEDDDDE